VNAANDGRQRHMAAKVIDARGDSVSGKTFAVVGVVEAPSVEIVPMLQQAGAKVRTVVPCGVEPTRPILGDVVWCESAYEAIEGADTLVLVTAGGEFRVLDVGRKATVPVGDDPILRPPEASAYVRMAESTLAKRRLRGNPPAFLKLGSRLVGYRLSVLDRFLVDCRRESTSDTGRGTE
jgi:predicted DNA-binding transcriptional regulator AlpA